jgi:branched-subunit amino acid transport protein
MDATRKTDSKTSKIGTFIPAETLIGWFSKNLLTTIVGGMACFALWQWFLNSI